MRGRERVVVAGLLTATAAGTGALAGLVVGAAWRLVGPAIGWPVVAALVVAAVVLDLARVTPLAVRRQVPQLWGRIFGAPTVAVLYGARLGIGPLTILRTWLWWGAFVLGASTGPWWSALVGAVFGSGRVLVMLAAGTRAGGARSRERRAAPVLAVVAVAAVAVGWAVAPGETGGSDQKAAGRAASGGGGAAGAGTRDDREPVAADAADASTTSTSASAPVPVPDQGLAAALPETILPGFDRVADDPRRRLGPLDLAAAAAIEGDEPAERALLETRRFQRGQARAWRSAAGQVAHASVYVFASSADADAYRVDGLTTIEARGARVYDVDVPAGARGFSQATQAQAGAGSTVAHGVTFVRGDRFYLVFVTSADSSLGPGEAAAAASAVASAAGG